MVSNTDVLGGNALASARPYMGGVAWPTVIRVRRFIALRYVVWSCHHRGWRQTSVEIG